MEIGNIIKGRGATPAQRVSNKLGYSQEDELLMHYPRRYEDRTKWLNPLQVPLGENVTVRGKIVSKKFARWKGGRSCFEAVLQIHDSYDTLLLLWYGISYLQTIITEGKELIVYGKIMEKKKGRQISHPEFEIISEEKDGNEHIHFDRITPIYPATEGLSQRAIRVAIYHKIFTPDFDVRESCPYPKAMVTRTYAYKNIHFPESWEAQEKSRQRLVYDELFRMQTLLAIRRAAVKRVDKEREAPRKSLITPFRALLPFTLTQAQERVCLEIDKDMSQPYPMNRLLQGDVGSGKTMVAMHAMLRALEQGKNAALLAPTEILAEQHYLNFKKWCESLQVQVDLWTRTRKPSKDETLFASRGRIFIGTHALIQEKAEIPNLGIGVIDEQHKFGVLQRAAFQQKGDSPDLLVMTATPIPRTLSLTLYGDLDISILDEVPPGRGNLRTFLRAEKDLPKIWDFIKKEIAEGRQAYVVYPLIEESDKIDLKSVEKAAEEFKSIFGEGSFGILHGRMEAEEKEAVMKKFRTKEFGVLVATTVIEVGVDVPNATVMVIEHAERFGLAQLHQLRGRVGRGANNSYCILVGRPTGEDGWRRLKIMEETSDGFRLAEEDFKIRGPGDMLGTEQSGLPPLLLADIVHDRVLLEESRFAAQALVKSEPGLNKWPLLIEELQTYFKNVTLPVIN